MSPEQALGRLDLMGSQSDVFSLGATLFEILTGKRPYQGDGTTSALQLAQQAKYPRPRALNASIPKPLEAICLKAMACSQQNRYSTAHALASDIENYLDDEPVIAYNARFIERTAQWARKHPKAITSLVLIFLGAVFLAFLRISYKSSLDHANRQIEIATYRDEMTLLRRTNDALSTLDNADNLFKAEKLQQAEVDYSKALAICKTDERMSALYARASASLLRVQGVTETKRQQIARHEQLSAFNRHCDAALFHSIAPLGTVSSKSLQDLHNSASVVLHADGSLSRAA